jgi:pimeloyl-ACP methyl ester carboxylesterase
VDGGAARPLWFGDAAAPARTCFGWYHAPAPGMAARTMGVVVCPPFGHEYLCTHRSLRQLAELLASRGFHVMRFDYPGTGDSPGDDRDPGRVEAWLAGVGLAADELLAQSGIGQVAFFGLRLGATLAASAAAGRADVGALVLMAPCASGGAFLREMRAMRGARDRGELRAFSGQGEGDEEAIGFVYRADTVEALKGVDLRTLAARPAPRVLIVPRDDVPGHEPRIAERMRSLGAEVALESLPGYAAMMSEDPYFAIPPTTAWARIAAWLAAADASIAPVRGVARRGWRAALEDHVELELAGRKVRERVFGAGEGKRLFGVVSEPLERRGDLAVILLNTGANHRIGTNRLGVRLARTLAAAGVTTLRLDMGGIGDSAPAIGCAENELYARHSIGDVRAAMDALVAEGFTRFALVGLCSGAYVAFHTSLEEPRVAGLTMLNPLAFEWREGDAIDIRASERKNTFRASRYYRAALFRKETWMKVVRGDVHVRGIAGVFAKKALAKAKALGQELAFAVGRDEWITDVLARRMGSLVRRGVEVRLVFNGHEPALDDLNERLGALRRRLDASGRFRLEIVDGADHVFVPVWSQDHVIDVVSTFVRERVAHASAQ